MRRYGNLFKKIVSFDNLILATRKAFRGKKDKARVAKFYFHMETEILKLQEELCSGGYQMQPYRTFEIFEPKRRKICAADFRDRVVHHAICNVLGPIFEKGSISDTYACREGKGSHAAVKKAQEFARRMPYFLKCDVRKYFESIDHAVLKALLRRKFKDETLLTLLNQIINHPIPGGVSGKGIPIGNLTSQYFANLYLGELDHLLKDRLSVKGYLRYMDDFLIFSTRRSLLHETLADIRNFLNRRLSLDLKEDALILAPVTEGIAFLGFRIFPDLVKLDRKKWTRFRHKVKKLEEEYRIGIIDENELAKSVQSMVSHILHADTLSARRKFFDGSLSLG